MDKPNGNEDKVYQSYLDTIVNNVPHAIVWKDCQSRFLGCNRVFAMSAGFHDPKDLIGKTDFDMPWKNQAHLYVMDDKAVMKQGIAKLNIEEPQTLPTGEVIILNTSKVPLADANGHTIGVLVIYTDVTEKKMAETELREAKENAEIANLVKSEFLATTSHELRTPLNAIIGMTQLLLQKEKEEETLEMLQAIMQASSHLLGMITDLLSFTKLEAGQFLVNKTIFSVTQCVTQTVNHLSHLLEDQEHVSLVSEFGEKLSDFIYTDEKCLRQLLFNLVGNAIKFTHQGSIVVKINTKKTIKSQAILRIDVIDTGIGIPEDKIALVFDRFTQLDSTYDRRYGGAGLGLAICKRLVECLNGEIGVKSQQGKGTHFWIKIPCELSSLSALEAQNANANIAASIIPGTLGSCSSLPYMRHYRAIEQSLAIIASNYGHETDQPTRKPRVVIVEDDKVNQIVLNKMLTSLGVMTSVFSDVKTTLQYLKEAGTEVDAIFTDIGLPEINGIALIKLLRNELGYKHLPILAVTGFCAQYEVKQIIAAGANEIIYKPITLDVLKAMVDYYIGKDKKSLS